MARQIYVNLSVKNLERSKVFFSDLGFTFDPDYSNDVAVCMIISENIYVMLLTEPFFATFTAKAICDAKSSTEVLVCLSCDSRTEVDKLVEKALIAGGTAPRKPQDHGFMYGHGFEDIDGHIWELIYMKTSPQT